MAPLYQPSPLSPKRLNITALPLTSPKIGILFSKYHMPKPPGEAMISSRTSLEKCRVSESSCLIDITMVSREVEGVVRKVYTVDRISAKGARSGYIPWYEMRRESTIAKRMSRTRMPECSCLSRGVDWH